jgi:hypothetical protein
MYQTKKVDFWSKVNTVPSLKKKLIHFLLCLGAAIVVASPVFAQTLQEESDFHFSPKLDSFRIDPLLKDATEIATLNAYKRSHHRCWRSIKDALVEAKVIPFRPTSRYAKQAGIELQEKFGFSKLEISDPFEAPVNSILVYGGPGAGHVEFRTPNGFVSDFINPRPPHRPLIGVYVRAESHSKVLLD